MKKKTRFNKKVALGALSLCLLIAPEVRANEEPLEEFTLEPISVTATRIEKKDLDIPATIRVYTAEDLENTGASTVIEALKFSEGLVYHSQGPAGQSISTMTSKIISRGMDKGTIVMINGVPINLRGGSVTLENLPIAGIERVEVMKGNGSVLYGSEASSGVINIITKDDIGKTIDLSMGNYKQKKGSLSWQEGKLSFNYSHLRLGGVDKYSDSRTKKGNRTTNYNSNLLKSVKDSVFATYKFSDKLSITQLYTKNRYSRNMTVISDTRTGAGFTYNPGDVYQANDYNTYISNTFFTYKDDTVTARLYNNQRNVYNKTLKNSSGNYPNTTARYTDKTRGLDFQKRFDLKKGNIMAGFDAHQEVYTSNTTKRDRMFYSLFAQWHEPFNEKFEMDLGLRFTKTANTEGGYNYNNVSPQLQFLYKKSNNTSYYMNVGRSFVMPYFSQIFGSGTIIGNPGLKPQTGWQYEVGAKHIKGIHAWRAAIFYMDIVDNIAYRTVGGLTRYENEDFRNAGLELSYDIKLKNGLSMTTGLTLSNPKIRNVGGVWQSKYGRYQLNLGLNYVKDKWKASLHGNFLGNRTNGTVNSGQEGAKALFLTSLHISYSPIKNQEIYFNMDNILNRSATQTHSSVGSYYFQSPRMFEVGYKFSF